jgi:hypothetical protein
VRRSTSWWYSGAVAAMSSCRASVDGGSVPRRGVQNVGEQAADVAPSAVDRCAVHAGAGGDGFHGESVVTVFAEFGEDRVEDLRTGSGGPAAGAAPGR